MKILKIIFLYSPNSSCTANFHRGASVTKFALVPRIYFVKFISFSEFWFQNLLAGFRWDNRHLSSSQLSNRSATATDDEMALKHTFVTREMVISSGVPETFALLPVILRYVQVTKLSDFGYEYEYCSAAVKS